MDQKEHVATLCALGTVGAAAAGLAFATDQVESHVLRPGKRKWPGASNTSWAPSTMAPIVLRRSISQPTTPILPSDSSAVSSHYTQPKRFSSAPRTSVLREEDPMLEEPSSRASSKSRRSMLRPLTSASRSTSDKRDSSGSSSWLKRLSSLSSHSTSTTSSLKFAERDDYGLPATLTPRPSTSTTSVPNKLVKRSISQRGLSHEEARGQILRRPATSHQRSQTFRDILSRPTTAATSSNLDFSAVSDSDPVLTSTGDRRPWQCFFEAAFPRKRRRSESATDSSQIRVVSLPLGTSPVLLLGTELGGSQSFVDNYDRPQPQQPQASNVTTATRRPRRSLGSLRTGNRRRNFTDPSVQLSRTAANGTISPVKPLPQSSPMMNGSTLDVVLPPGTPQFTSSPPMLHFGRRSSFRPRSSLTTSDHPTVSSDMDGQVFSDGDSMDFKSDTAYDSIATRATNASYSGKRELKLETIFAARTSDELDAQPRLWQDLSQQNHVDASHTKSSPFLNRDIQMHGIGIAISDEKQSTETSVREDIVMATPPRSPSIPADDMNATPIPHRIQHSELNSSPPLFPLLNATKQYDEVGEMLEDMKLDEEEEEVSWSEEDDSFLDDRPHPPLSGQIMSSLSGVDHPLIAGFKDAEASWARATTKSQRPSIFDWSEHQQANGLNRPKTVHGKQSNGTRSRSSGKMGPPQLHFRSQSVPVNRDGPSEEVASISKYQTLRLGHKPVSEEWSDDFEFDDADGNGLAVPPVDEEKNNFRDSVRSVRIPQAIIDRQPSVHLQFGQVQEFMVLVEELKRLKARAAELNILYGNAKKLWEDAEVIINLATINDEEEPTIAPSPTSSDPFADIPSFAPAPVPNGTPTSGGRRLTTTSRRSVSTMSTPAVHGRARGESLAQARHFLQTMHENRGGVDSSPCDIQIHHQKKTPFDTQDLKDLVVRSGAITRALKEEVRKAEGVFLSPHKTPPPPPPPAPPPPKTDHPLSNLFRPIEPHEGSPCPPTRKPGLPKSRSANSYLESAGARQHVSPFSSPMSLTAAV